MNEKFIKTPSLKWLFYYKQNKDWEWILEQLDNYIFQYIDEGTMKNNIRGIIFYNKIGIYEGDKDVNTFMIPLKGLPIKKDYTEEEMKEITKKYIKQQIKKNIIKSI